MSTTLLPALCMWFRTAERLFAIPLIRVAEVRTAPKPRFVPLVPPAVGGILEVRGESLPVVNGGVLFGSSPDPDPRHVLILELGRVRIGALVAETVRIQSLVERSAPSNAPRSPSFVRWLRGEKEPIGLVDSEGMIERATEMLTESVGFQGEDPCPTPF